MTVSELIELLKSCDPKARVVVDEEPLIDDDRNVLDGAMQVVDALEIGWAPADTNGDLAFSLKPIGGYLAPAVRILGCNHDRSDPDRKISINGVEPMKDAIAAPILKIERRS